MLNVREKVYGLLITFIFLVALLLPGSSQRVAKLDSSSIILSTLIDAQLEDEMTETSLQSIILLIKGHCGKDYDCLSKNYNDVIFKLERKFDLTSAIELCRELAKISNEYGDIEGEADVYRDLSRFHGALGNAQLEVWNEEKAYNLYEEAGNRQAAFNIRMSMLEKSIPSKGYEIVLPEMDSLLLAAEKEGLNHTVVYLNDRLINIKIDAGLYDEALKHIEALERIPISDPIAQDEYGIVINALLGRANLAMIGKNLDQAEQLFQQALRLCEEEPSRWMEIFILHQLTSLEWDRGNADLAKSYLNAAQSKAEVLELDELIAENYDLKAKIAIDEGRFNDALGFTNKKYYHQNRFQDRGSNFDMVNYFLQIEKDQLESSQKNQKLELQLKQNQLRNSYIVFGLVSLLLLGLTIGMFSRSKGMKRLSAQHSTIQQQKVKLEQLDQAKSRFFVNASHELRTPLSLILGPLRSVLKSSNLTGPQSKMLRIADQNGKHLEQLVNGILDLSKLDIGKMMLELEPTIIYSFFHTYLSQYESLAQSKDVKYSWKLNADQQREAKIDRAKIRQILYNLLSNAFKYTPSGGKIEVILQELDNGLIFHISNSGPVIHPDDLPHLFERYYQTSRPESPAEGGTGIGLALCHEYVKLMDGKIEVASEEGKGTEFKVFIPVNFKKSVREEDDNDRQHSDPLSGSIDHMPASGSAIKTDDSFSFTDDSASIKPTILVVEDNADQQEFIHMILNGSYNVLTADNGKAALRYLKSYPGIQLILSDIMMPVKDGFQLLERLRSQDASRHIPVIMLTARADARSKLKALRIGVDDYIVKPFEEEELTLRIENLLKNHHVRTTEAQMDDNLQEDRPRFSQECLQWLQDFESYVQKNIGDDTMNIPFLASQFSMSESTFLRQVKRLTGLSPSQYLKEVRLDKARQLLENHTFNSIAKVAYEVGYADSRSFSRSFKKRYGKLPSEFKVI